MFDGNSWNTELYFLDNFQADNISKPFDFTQLKVIAFSFVKSESV